MFARQLRFIAQCEDSDALRRLIRNFKGLEDEAARRVVQTAWRRIAELSAASVGTDDRLETDFWGSLVAFEAMESEARGRTFRFARTRQKAARVGVATTLGDWARGKPTEGFGMALARGVPELTGEAIILRHASRFPAEVVEAAKRRLQRYRLPHANLADPPT